MPKRCCVKNCFRLTVKNVILVFSEQETNKGKCLELEIVLDILLLVCPCYVPWSWVPGLVSEGGADDLSHSEAGCLVSEHL